MIFLQRQKAIIEKRSLFSSDFNSNLENEYMQDPLNFKMTFDLLLYEDKIFQFNEEITVDVFLNKINTVHVDSL